MSATGRELVRSAVDGVKRLYGRCAFCGRPCYGRTCRGHRDLLDLDPNQQLRTRRENT